MFFIFAPIYLKPISTLIGFLIAAAIKSLTATCKTQSHPFQGSCSNPFNLDYKGMQGSQLEGQMS